MLNLLSPKVQSWKGFKNRHVITAVKQISYFENNLIKNIFKIPFFRKAKVLLGKKSNFSLKIYFLEKSMVNLTDTKAFEEYF